MKFQSKEYNPSGEYVSPSILFLTAHCSAMMNTSAKLDFEEPIIGEGDPSLE